MLDLTAHIAGPYATKLLADLGARVIKIERPGGDPARAFRPWLGDEPGIERSGTYQFLNTNKQSVVLDLKSAAGRAVLDRLVPLADLVVVGQPPAVAERLHTTPEALREVADVNVLSLTNFGWTGPYRDYSLSETVLYAMGGEMFSHGLAGREPLKLGGTASLIQCGAMAAIAALGRGPRQRAPRHQPADRRLPLRCPAQQRRPAQLRDPGLPLLRPRELAAGGGRPGGGGGCRRCLPLRGWLRRDHGFGRGLLASGSSRCSMSPRCVSRSGATQPGSERRKRAPRSTRSSTPGSSIARGLRSGRRRGGPTQSSLRSSPRRTSTRTPSSASGVSGSRSNTRPSAPSPSSAGRTCSARRPGRSGRAAPRLGQDTAAVLAEAGYDGAAIDDLTRSGAVA